MKLEELERSLLGDIWASPALPESLSYLCDVCNGRFAGSKDEQRAGDFLFERLLESGLENVAFEAFEMLGWVRGDAALVVRGGIEPRPLPCMALPGSPRGAIDARLADVGLGTRADFERLEEGARGCIVLVDAGGPHRLEKYARSCTAGSVGFVFAHAEPGMLTPTGSLSLGADPAPLPGVGVALETASFLRRLLERGAVHLRMTVDAQPQGVGARNVVAEIPGRVPESGWVVACAHYDGHDVARGAQDNATGTAVVLEAARVLAPLRAHLKAGLRFCLFSGEEMGMRGSAAYVRAHAGELNRIRTVLNTDMVGLAAPLVLAVQNSATLAAHLRKNVIVGLDVLLEERLLTAHSDHFPFMLAGVPAMVAHTSFPQEGGDWAHTAADTLDKLDVRELREAAGTMARILVRMAAAPAGLPRAPKPLSAVKEALIEAGLEESLRVQGSWPF